MTPTGRLAAHAALRMLWSYPSFPGRWRVQRWALDRASVYAGFPPRHLAMADFEVEIEPAANIDVFLNGITSASPIERIIRALVRPGDAVLDIGANLGWTARLLSTLVGAGGQVHAFEPIPTAFANLQRNVEAAPLRNISVHFAAASDLCGQLDLYLPSEDATALATMRSPENGTPALRYRVPTVTIDSLLDRLPKVAFAKIDVEGAEHKVLLGMDGLIARDRPALAIELSDAWLRRLGSSASALLDHLASRGYEAFRLTDSGLQRLSAVPEQQVDVACLPAGTGLRA